MLTRGTTYTTYRSYKSYETYAAGNPPQDPLRGGLAFASLGKLAHARTFSSTARREDKEKDTTDMTYKANMADNANRGKADMPHVPYMPYKSYRTYEAKAVGKSLEFEAKAHHQSSIII